LRKIGEAKVALEQEAKDKAALQSAKAEQKPANCGEEKRCTSEKKLGSKPELPILRRPSQPTKRNVI
jgi:hypothetical protein